MISEHDQGLGISIAIYMVAVVCGLALFLVPVFLANTPRIIANAGMAAYEPPPGTLLIPRPARYSSAQAVLFRDETVDPVLLAIANAKVKSADKPHQLASRRGQRVGLKAPPAPTRYAQPTNIGRSFF